jgi:ribosomal protein S18 acetylase RimI-like enzyme
MELRRITPEDWQDLRTVRLAALADSPTAFITRYDEAAEYPDELWQRQAVAGSAGSEQAAFLLFDGKRVCGMAAGLSQAENADEVLLVGMWVAPPYRRSGHGARLVKKVVHWAAGRGAVSVVLGVTSGNDSAVALYESCGFSLTGRRRDLPGHSALVEHTMELQLFT